MAHFAEHREDACVERREVVQVVAIHALDPRTVCIRASRVTHADSHDRAHNGSGVFRKHTARTGARAPVRAVFELAALSSISSRLLLRRLGRGRSRSGGSVGRRRRSGISRRRGGAVSRRRGFSGRSSRSFSSRRLGSRSGSFLLRAGRENQRSNESAKNEFRVHRSIPREARVVRKHFKQTGCVWTLSNRATRSRIL